MSSVPTQPGSTPAERRVYPRKRLDQLAYIGFGPDTGGVLLDVSEEGLRCQIVGAVVEGDQCHLKFALPGRHSPIEADGQVVWSNRSRQGGGVRLVGLGPDTRQELQQWIREELASSGPRKPAFNGSAKNVGAIHTQRLSSSPASAASVPFTQESVALINDSSAAVVTEQHEGAQKAQPSSDAADAEIVAAVGTPARGHSEQTAPLLGDEKPDTGPPTVTVQPDERLPVAAERAEPAKIAPVTVAPRAATAHKAASHVAEPRRAVSKPAEHRARLTSTDFESHQPRFTKVAVAAGCVLTGIVVLAFSGFNPADLFSTRQIDSGITASAMAAPVSPRVAGLTSLAATVHLSESARPSAASDAADHLSRDAAQTPRPEPPTPSTAPASRPSQNSAPARTSNRQRMPLALARPRAGNPAPPTIVAPEVPFTPTTAPAPLMNMPALDSRTTELVQPGTDYRPPQLLSQVEPVYSAFARQSRLQGTVRVNATIGADGVPRSPVCVSGNSALCQMAVQAIGEWRYQPATSDGQPVQTQVLVNFNFQLR